MHHKPIPLRFREQMKGYVSFDPAAGFEQGYAAGKAANTACSFAIEIEIADIDAFVRDPNAQASARGHVDCPALGGRCQIEKGRFNLLVDVVHRRHRAKDMRYRLWFRTPDGRLFTLAGTKYVDDDGLLHMWRDTTKLFTKIYEGDVDRDGEDGARVVACGIIWLGILDFIKMIPSFSAKPAGLGALMRAQLRFTGYFAKGLWQVYGPHFLQRAG